ncbi:MAG: hypothetical protein GC206_06500, partial [Alphaproteobacteria bacterium]|nr:hypothetical protein [Alphaproteobacteria bacterium]
MARRRRSRRLSAHGRVSRNASINVTPFVDVMLVLLIVFMVTAPLLTVGVELNLPRTQARPLNQAVEPLTVSLRADGALFLQETPVELETLLPRLDAIAEAGYDQQIYVRADAAVPYNALAQVLASMSGAGYSRVSLVTDTLEQGGRTPARAARGSAPDSAKQKCEEARCV